MLDEAHERSLSTDILFGLLKQLVRTRRYEAQTPQRVPSFTAAINRKRLRHDVITLHEVMLSFPCLNLYPQAATAEAGHHLRHAGWRKVLRLL